MPTVAIVGRPNVGKSALFNRLAGRRIAIVHDQPGVTRDRISAPCKHLPFPCEIIDTGGIGIPLEDGFGDAVSTEASIAMETADLILFVVDAQEGMTNVDVELAKKLHSAKPPVLLVINKADNQKIEDHAIEFSRLGYGTGIALSAELGIHFGQLIESMKNLLEPLANHQQKKNPLKKGLKIALVGRPNAGKSSLVNAILHDERTIVSPIAGTTRDSLDIPYSFQGEEHTLIDTAGMRRRSKQDTSVEVFSSMRAQRSIRRCDLCLLTIDLAAGITAQDRKIARIIQEEQKPCIIVLNKFDLFHPDAPKKARLEEALEICQRELFFVQYAPALCLSALHAQSIGKIFETISLIQKGAHPPITTGKLNRILAQAFEQKPPQAIKGKKRLKLLYATTAVREAYTAIPVPTYILFVNDKNLAQDHYLQYLTKVIRNNQSSLGLPITFSIRSRNTAKK